MYLTSFQAVCHSFLNKNKTEQVLITDLILDLHQAGLKSGAILKVKVIRYEAKDNQELQTIKKVPGGPSGHVTNMAVTGTCISPIDMDAYCRWILTCIHFCFQLKNQQNR